MPADTPRSRPLALTLPVLLALLGGLLVLAPASQAADDPYLGAPTEDTCSVMTAKQVMKVTAPSKTVNCEKRHTTLVSKVALLPEGLDYDDRDLFSRVSQICADNTARKVGGDLLSRRRTFYATHYFVPTKAQQERGARWYRCDIGLYAAGKMFSHRGSYPKVTKNKIPDAVGRCITAKRAYTVCSQKHAYKHRAAAQTPKLSKNQKKQAQQLAAFAQKQCAKKADSEGLYSADVSGTRRYVVVCYAKV